MKKSYSMVQGSPEWHALRATALGTASEAAAMMGCDPNTSRDELLLMKKFGYEKEISEYVKRFIFTEGHKTEKMARPIIERMLKEELYPETITNIIDGMLLLASLDGKSLLDEVNFEHKQWNEKLAEMVINKDLDPYHYWQLEQQLLVGEIEKAIFVVSDGTEDRMELMYYESLPERRKAIIAGWKQFKLDLENYQPVVEVVKPAAKAIMELPALDIQIRGEVKNSNLAVYEEAALSFIEGINTDLQTDQDFADAEKAVKFCGEAEKQLELAKKQILSQAHDIDLITRTLDKIKEEMRSKRLVVDKIVKAEKANRRNEILQGAMEQFSDHLEGLRKSLGGDYLPELTFDPATAMKGKKTITSLQSAANDELARAKIAANEVVERIRMNMKAYSEAGGPDYNFLFGDLKTILQKEREDFLLLVQSRINTHKHAEEAKLEAERQRIRAEEQAKAEREKLAELNRLAQEQEEKDRIEEELRQAELKRLAQEQEEKDRAAREAEEQKERERLAEERRKEAEIAEAERKAEAERQEKARIDKEEAQKRQGEEYRTELSAKISDSLIENGIGKTVAKKVAELIVAGKIEGVMV